MPERTAGDGGPYATMPFHMGRYHTCMVPPFTPSIIHLNCM